jgi:hypothetical membrane protein
VVRQRLGALALVAAPVVFLALQLVAQSRWSAPGGYSWSRNNISDLGNVHCGPYGDRLVCSPGHRWMNLGFVLNGLLLAVGVHSLSPDWRAAGRRWAQRFLLLGALGWTLAGVFPADRALAGHLTGATLIFWVWPVAAIRSRRVAGWPAAVAGWLSLAGFVGLFFHAYAGLGPGGMERVAAYPVEVWLFLLGVRRLAGPRVSLGVNPGPA